VAVPLSELPRFLVLEPLSTVRVEIRLASPACEIDVELERPAPGRSFVLLIGHKDGPFVQRVRLAGKARVYFDPQSPGEYVILRANPQKEPITLRLKAREVGRPFGAHVGEQKPGRGARSQRPGTPAHGPSAKSRRPRPSGVRRS